MSNTFRDIMDYLYSPLSKKWCDFYYYLAVISFILFVFMFVGAFTALISKTGVAASNKMVRTLLYGVVGVLAVALPSFLGYFQARLMYSMCEASLK